MKKLLIFIIGLLFLLVVGCGGTSSPVGTDKYTIVDANDRTVVVEQPPQRIVALSPSFLELLQAVDGKVVGRAKTQIGQVPDFAKKADEGGYIFNINIEKVVSLHPDMVIAYKGMHERYISILESNKIPVIVLSLKTYDDVKNSLLIMGKMLRREEKGRQVAASLDAAIQQTVQKMPKIKRTVAIIHTTNMGVTLEKDTSIAGCCAKMLQLENIVHGATKLVAGPMGSQPDMAPYSLENLVEKNPQVIFITSMGSKQEIGNKLRSEVTGNPAWGAIEAVRNKQVFYLPDELFLLNPGLRYPEAIRIMASKLHPDLVEE